MTVAESRIVALQDENATQREAAACHAMEKEQLRLRAENQVLKEQVARCQQEAKDCRANSNGLKESIVRLEQQVLKRDDDKTKMINKLHDLIGNLLDKM